MLKPIRRVDCSPALVACQKLMQRFALWLCRTDVDDTSVTHANLLAVMSSSIEGDWLWDLIAVDKRSAAKEKKLLSQVKLIAKLSIGEKQGLEQWIQQVAQVAQHFGAAPPPKIPVAPPNGWKPSDQPWKAFQAVMVAFYLEGLRHGLPYQSNGVATANTALRVTYEQFTREFRKAHRPDKHDDGREICVLCGGPLVVPAVDHWISKGTFPLLAVCADNLLPVCVECNVAPQKGQEPVHDDGVFAHWFHPYLRHAGGILSLQYDAASFSVKPKASDLTHEAKVENLDQLLNLEQRWTREFKAEFRKLLRHIETKNKERTKAGSPSLGPSELLTLLAQYRQDISEAEPHYEVHRVLGDALLDWARQQALLPP